MNVGKFYNVKSVIHDISAELKFLFLVLFSIEIFFINKFWVYVIILFLILILIKLSRVPFKLFFINVKIVLPMILLTSGLNIFFISQGNVIFKFFFIRVTDYALNLILTMMCRIITLLFFSLLIMFTTSVNKLSRAVIYIFMPLKNFLPVNEIAMILNIALRFIPVLSDEFDLILKAQKSRQIDFDDKNIFSKVKNYVSVLIPVFILSFRRADDLALAMESRCYNPDSNKKKVLKKIKFKRVDFDAMIFIFVVHILIFFLNTISR